MAKKKEKKWRVGRLQMEVSPWKKVSRAEPRTLQRDLDMLN